MTAYLVSLLMGLAVGAAYGLLHVRSPAPPLIALVGLLGMVLGEQAIDAARHHSIAPSSQTDQAPTLPDSHAEQPRKPLP